MAKDNGKSIGLDLSKFSHVSHDDKSHTLKHYEGHTITLATKALSKANREALKGIADRHAEKMANGGEVKKKLTGVEVDEAAKGVDYANKYREQGDASPNGVVIEVNKDKKPNYGKVTDPKGQKPRVFAEGGEVKKPNPSEMTWDNLTSGIKSAVAPSPTPQPTAGPVNTKYGRSKYAEGGNVEDEQPIIPMSLAADPNAQPTIPMTNPSPGSGLPDLTNTGIQDTLTAIDRYPQERMDHMKSMGYTDPMDEKAILSKLGEEKNAREAGAVQRTQDEYKQSTAKTNASLDLIKQKQALGIALSPEEQATLTQQQTPLAQEQQSMQPDAGVQAAANQMQQQPVVKGDGIPSPEGMLGQGYKSELAGINAQAKAQGALGQEQAGLLRDQVVAQEQAKAHYQDTYNNLEQERQALMADIQEGHVDPNKYWTGDKDGNGGHSKMMAGIGMILAGFNPTTQPNAAINFLKQQMDMNLQAQVKNLDSKQNLLSMNLRQFGNLKDATEMTRIMQNDMVVNQLQAAAAKAQSPMAKAAAMQAAGKLQMDSAPQFQQFAMRRAMMQMANSSGGNQSPQAVEQMLGMMRVMNPEMAKSMEARYVPGVGLGTVPIPESARTEIIGKQSFDKAAQHYVDWVKQNAGSMNPAKINAGATMAAELQGMYRQAVKGGVYKEGEQEFIEKLIPSDPAQFIGSIRTLPKVQELLKSNQMQLNQLKSGYGLPAQQSSAAPAGPQYKVVNGIKYMRGPNGQAVPVK